MGELFLSTCCNNAKSGQEKKCNLPMDDSVAESKNMHPILGETFEALGSGSAEDSGPRAAGAHGLESVVSPAWQEHDTNSLHWAIGLVQPMVEPQPETFASGLESRSSLASSPTNTKTVSLGKNVQIASPEEIILVPLRTVSDIDKDATKETGRTIPSRPFGSKYMQMAMRRASGTMSNFNDLLQDDEEEEDDDHLIDNIVGSALLGDSEQEQANARPSGGKAAQALILRTSEFLNPAQYAQKVTFKRQSTVMSSNGSLVGEEKDLIRELFGTGIKPEKQHRNLHIIISHVFVARDEVDGANQRTTVGEADVVYGLERAPTVGSLITNASHSRYKGVRIVAQQLIRRNSFILFFMALTIYAIFGPDVVSLLFGKEVDLPFQLFNTLVFFLFILELVMQVLGRPGYCWTVMFFLDTVSVVSILSDTYLFHAFEVDKDSARVSRMARSSRMTRLARIVRIARFTRLLPRLMRLCSRHREDLGRQLAQKRLWRSFLYLDQDLDGYINHFDVKCFYAVVLCEGTHMFRTSKDVMLKADIDLLCKADEDMTADKLSFQHFESLIFSTQLGKQLVAHHVEDVQREDGVWALVQKLSDSSALKICVGMLILVAVMAVLEVEVIDEGPQQGLMQLAEIVRAEKNAGASSTSYICEQIAVYTRIYAVFFVYLDGHTYFDRGKCLKKAIPLQIMDPWERVKDIIDQSSLRRIEIVQSCWADMEACNKDRTSSMSLVDARDGHSEELVASLLIMTIVIAMLLVFVYALNTGMTRFSKTLLQPLRALVDDLAAMSQLDLVNVDREMPQKEGVKKENVAEELRSLQEACTAMRAAIKSWSRYVPPVVVQRLFKAGVEASIGVTRAFVTILFCDIKDFEDKVRGLLPEDVLELLCKALNKISAVIDNHKGTLLEFIGDEVLAVFNTPNSLRHHTFAGVASALDIHKAVADMAPLHTSDGREIPITCRCGVNTCSILAGNIGATQRIKYGLLGDGINLTARLKGINSKYMTKTLFSDKVLEDAYTQHLVVYRPVDLVAVKGKTEPTAVFEPLCLRAVGDDHAKSMSIRRQDSNASIETASDGTVLPPPMELWAEKHIEAFELYKQRQFKEAAVLFEEVRLFFESEGRADEPSRVLRMRCQRYEQEPPPDDWDGVERLTKK